MSFTGTLDKCKACDKTVYFLDLLTVDGVPYHKTCFKCSHCKGTLVMSNYSSMDGVLYCKTHFEQLFKESGDFSKKFQTGQKEKSYDGSKAVNKMSSLFTGTQDKCSTCGKTVYPLEKITLEGEAYHKTCFRCTVGGCPLTHSSYAALDGVLYCKTHFGQLFMEKGSYSHILEASKKKNQEGETHQVIDDEVGEEATETKEDEDEENVEAEGGVAEGEEETEDNVVDPDHGKDHTPTATAEEEHNHET